MDTQQFLEDLLKSGSALAEQGKAIAEQGKEMAIEGMAKAKEGLGSFSGDQARFVGGPRYGRI